MAQLYRPRYDLEPAADLEVLLNAIPAGTRVVDIGYRPRKHQAVLHSMLKRFNALVCHRRFGKTVFVIAEMIDRGLSNELKNPVYAYIAPTYGQAKRVAWEYLKDYCSKIPGATAHEQELTIRIPRPHRDDHIKFMLLGAENPDSLRGIYLDGAVLDEFAQCSPILWGEIIRPALSDRKGWAIFVGTPKGQNHFHKIYMEAEAIAREDGEESSWFSAMFKASETGVVDDEELADAKRTMSEDEYEQEYECSFQAALKGAYYATYMNDLKAKGQICSVPYDPAAMVSTFWDLGISDTTFIWFIQLVGREYHVIDCLEMSGKGLEWYVQEIKKKPYIYHEHWLPHDAAARELGTGVTRQETLRKLGLSTYIVPKQNVADGIHAVRMVLPKCWFDAVKTKKGQDALTNYERKYDAKNNMFLDSPLHNWASNGADAFRQFALVCNPDRMAGRKRDLPRTAESSHYALR